MLLFEDCKSVQSGSTPDRASSHGLSLHACVRPVAVERKALQEKGV